MSASGIALAVALAGSSASGGEPYECPAVPADRAGAERLARTLFEDAVGREQADPEGALERLRCAQRAADRPAVALRIGNIHERMGRLTQAADAFERYLELAGKDAPDAGEMRDHIARLREGARRQREGTTSPAPVSPPPAPAATGVSERPLIPPAIAFVVAGLGGALMITGTALLADAKAKGESVRELEGTPWTSDEAGPTHEAAKTEQTLGIGALAIGAVLGAAGLVVALTGKPSITVRPAPAAVAVGASMRF